MSNPHAIVEIDGFQWDSWKHPNLFSRVTVELTTGMASEAEWECVDEDFRIINKYTVQGGVAFSVMRVWLGFGESLGEPVFKGLLTRVQRGAARTTFVAYDMGFKMRLVQKAEYHKGTELEIIAKLVKRNGLLFQGPAKPLKLEAHKAMAQDGQTDWEHIAELAHDAGLMLWCRGDTVFADYPAKVGVPKTTLKNRQDFTILNDFDLTFRVPENRGGRPKGVEVRGRGRGGKRLTGSSDKSSRGHQELLIKRDLARHTKAYATMRAQAQKELDREHAFTLFVRSISALPDSRVDVRDTIAIVEVGDLFSSKGQAGKPSGYIADKVVHELTPGRLTTSYDLHRDTRES
jgi:hypothetical protein